MPWYCPSVKLGDTTEVEDSYLQSSLHGLDLRPHLTWVYELGSGGPLTDRVRQYPAGFWDLYFLILLTHERLQASQTTRTMEVDGRGTAIHRACPSQAHSLSQQ